MREWITTLQRMPRTPRFFLDRLLIVTAVAVLANTAFDIRDRYSAPRTVTVWPSSNETALTAQVASLKASVVAQKTETDSLRNEVRRLEEKGTLEVNILVVPCEHMAEILGFPSAPFHQNYSFR